MNRHPIAARLADTVSRFIHVEALSGVALIAAALLAVAWANLAGDHYDSFWSMPVAIGAGGVAGVASPVFVINDVLMTSFFLVAGLEIRRELREGTLASLRLAALPLATALGGILMPAMIYLAIGSSAPLRDGWAVPTATDIAFAVGVLALLGPRVPQAVRILLLALAIVDDIVAILVIALFYSGGIEPAGVLLAIAGAGALLGARVLRLRAAWVWMLSGALIWWGLLQAGVHPTLSGIVVALLMPAQPAAADRYMHLLHPWVAYGVMPLFALANAGVAIDGIGLKSDASQGVLLAVALALVVGKPLGIMLAAWGAVRAGWCELPKGVGYAGILVIGALAGIGFTMSLFIATLAFSQPELLAAAKSGILLGSTLAAIVGLAAGWVVFPRPRIESPAPAPASPAGQPDSSTRALAVGLAALIVLAAVAIMLAALVGA